MGSETDQPAPNLDGLTEILEAYAACLIDSRSAIRRAGLGGFADLLDALHNNGIPLRREPTDGELEQARKVARILRENR